MRLNDEPKAAMLRAEIEALSAIIDAEGYMAEGYKGQPVPTRPWPQRRASLRLLYAIESRMTKGWPPGRRLPVRQLPEGQGGR